MNENLNRIKPRVKPDLHPRLFRQLLDPIRQSQRLGIGIDEYFNSSKLCIGHFFDVSSKRVVDINLGYVTAQLVIQYRSSPSVASFLGAIKPFESEGDVLFCNFYEVFYSTQNLDAEDCPQRSEDSPQADEFKSGSHVIPGQSPLEWKNDAN